MGGKRGEVRSLMMGSLAMRRDTRESAASFSLLYKDTVRRETALCEAGTGSLPGTKLVSTLILDFPACRNARNQCLLSKPPVYGISLWQHELRHKDVRMV